MLDYLVDLHKVKAKSYGNSWCARGMSLSVLPFLDRKIDALSKGANVEENLQDLLVMFCKISVVEDIPWVGAPSFIDLSKHVEAVSLKLKSLEGIPTPLPLEDDLVSDLKSLVDHSWETHNLPKDTIEDMIPRLYERILQCCKQ